MEMILERKIHNTDSTEGNLWINQGDGWKWFSHVIEDVVRALPGQWTKGVKVPAKTAIPYGRYQVISSWSPKFNRMLTQILNVPDFSGIRIHNGSSQTSSAGCPIISYKNDDGPDNMKNRVVNDPKAMNDLEKLIRLKQGTEKIHIEIVDKKETALKWAA